MPWQELRVGHQKYRCFYVLMCFLVSGHPINSRRSWYFSCNHVSCDFHDPISWLPLGLCTWHISKGQRDWQLGGWNSLTWQLVLQKVLHPGAQVQQDLDGGSQTVGHIREESGKDLAGLHHGAKDRRKAFNSSVALEDKAFSTNGQCNYFHLLQQGQRWRNSQKVI